MTEECKNVVDSVVKSKFIFFGKQFSFMSFFAVMLPLMCFMLLYIPLLITNVINKYKMYDYP